MLCVSACGSSSPSQPAASSKAAGTPAGSAAPSGSPYTIGVTFPLTGPEANWGQLIIPAIQIVVDKTNAAGGVNGHPLRLDIKDTQGTPAGGVNAMRDVVETDHVPVVLSIFTNVVGAQAPLTKQFHIPIISTVEAQGFPKANGKYIFDVSPLHGYDDQLLARYWKAHDIKRVFMFTPNDPIGKYEENELASVWGPKGKNWNDALFQLGAGDFSGLVEKARAFHPDAVLITGHGTLDEPQIMKQLRQYGVNVPLFENTGTPTIYSYRAAMLPQAAGTIFTSVKCNLQQAAPWIAAYRAKIHHAPDYSTREWFDITRMVAAAFKTGYSSSAVENFMLHLHNFPSVCGTPLSVAPDQGQITPPVSMWQLEKNGKIVQLAAQ